MKWPDLVVHKCKARTDWQTDKQTDSTFLIWVKRFKQRRNKIASINYCETKAFHYLLYLCAVFFHKAGFVNITQYYDWRSSQGSHHKVNYVGEGLIEEHAFISHIIWRLLGVLSDTAQFVFNFWSIFRKSFYGLLMPLFWTFVNVWSSLCGIHACVVQHLHAMDSSDVTPQAASWQAFLIGLHWLGQESWSKCAAQTAKTWKYQKQRDRRLGQERSAQAKLLR